jgi:hypothetical protein
MYERPPTRFEHRTTTRTNPRSPAELVRSWEAFDRLFEDAFAPANQTTTRPDYSQTQSQFTDDNQTQSAFDTPKPQKQSTRELYDETPQSEFTQLYDDAATEMTADTETPLPGRYPKSYPLPEETPQTIHAPFDNGGADDIASSADEDFQRLWEEAERNRRKRMTRTVTRRRIMQHGVMSPTGTVSTIQPEPEHKQIRRKKSRYALHFLAPSYEKLTITSNYRRFRLYRNPNADYITATFDVPDVRKEDVHVAFQSSQLTITWESNITTERRADDRTIIREKKERKYARTLPLPPNTEVSFLE